jgi:hypothetical protein
MIAGGIPPDVVVSRDAAAATLRRDATRLWVVASLVRIPPFDEKHEGEKVKEASGSEGI